MLSEDETLDIPVVLHTEDPAPTIDIQMEETVIASAYAEYMESGGSGLFNGKIPVVFMSSFTGNLCSVSAMANLGFAFDLGVKNWA